jgi:hypothetical protein
MEHDLSVIDETTLLKASLSTEEEIDIAVNMITSLLREYLKHKTSPSRIYVSDYEELQSIIMYVAPTFGLEYARTSKKTYLE